MTTALELETAFARRVEPGLAVADAAEPIALACRDMAIRFHRGGRLIAFGTAGAAADVAHLAVEFVHPVLVGRRALPAISLPNDHPAGVSSGARAEAPFAARLRLLGRPDDIAVAITEGRLEPDPEGGGADLLAGLAAARDLGMLTIALAGGGSGAAADAVNHLLAARTDDPRVAKEVHVTTYHILWELVHVFLDQPGLLAPEVLP